MDVLKIGILGVAGVLLAVLLRKEKSEYSILISIVICVCIFLYIITKVETVINFVTKIESMTGMDAGYIGMVIKMVGITFVAEFAVNICKDAGYAAIASQIETFAKMSILVASLPVVMAFIDMIGSFL